MATVLLVEKRTKQLKQLKYKKDLRASGPFVNSLSDLRIRRIPILTFRNLLGFRSVKRCRKIVAYGDDSAGRAVVVDPFAVGNGHADATVGEQERRVCCIPQR